MSKAGASRPEAGGRATRGVGHHGGVGRATSPLWAVEDIHTYQLLSLLVSCQLVFRLRSRVMVMPEGGGTLVGDAGPMLFAPGRR